MHSCVNNLVKENIHAAHNQITDYEAIDSNNNIIGWWEVQVLFQFFKSSRKNRKFQIYELFKNFKWINLLENSNKFKGVIIHCNNHYISISYKNKEYKYLDSQKNKPIKFKNFNKLYNFCKKQNKDFLIFAICECKHKNYIFQSLKLIVKDNVLRNKFKIHIMNFLLSEKTKQIYENFKNENFFYNLIEEIHNNYTYNKIFVKNQLHNLQKSIKIFFF